jgi:hypothetical protein
VEGCCEQGNELSDSVKFGGKFLSICATGGFSRRAQLHEVSAFRRRRLRWIWHTACSGALRDLNFTSGRLLQTR